MKKKIGLRWRERKTKTETDADRRRESEKVRRWQIDRKGEKKREGDE